MNISVAAMYLISKSEPNTKYEITPKKLQKILYYAQAWHLVNEGKTLFENEDFQAWSHGPVHYPTYNEYKCYRYSSIPPVEFSDELDLHPFSQKEKNHLDSIWKVYGEYSADDLEHLTHEEDPWKITRGGLAPEAPSNEVIPEEIISMYYAKVSNDVLAGKWKSPLNPAPRLEWLITPKRKTAVNPLLKYVGTWSGNDLDECMEEVYNNRAEVQFH
ncbi:DUF4065 domain-containing protein [Bacillus subtilis]|uniref:Panacea domain-containing protein n=1 Tax=Bacillus subtilis TaxID=1423 RepID=UPI002149A80E|nr:type II toxin-antitoxin system antitoxin SocA domain-containing protein [Bacillus subtilis]MCR1994610.1 DUF4065 domain-containing protein [Bacillus subtilis]